mmetsp:Transcript_52181/g.86994  ORF Transcript_52181/g.86994 Transcript_52181/m.86994 type:complete len:292 (+) Transcript_52181:1693-2568(+)
MPVPSLVRRIQVLENIRPFRWLDFDIQVKHLREHPNRRHAVGGKGLRLHFVPVDPRQLLLDDLLFAIQKVAHHNNELHFTHEGTVCVGQLRHLRLRLFQHRVEILLQAAHRVNTPHDGGKAAPLQRPIDVGQRIPEEGVAIEREGLGIVRHARNVGPLNDVRHHVLHHQRQRDGLARTLGGLPTPTGDLLIVAHQRGIRRSAIWRYIHQCPMRQLRPLKLGHWEIRVGPKPPNTQLLLCGGRRVFVPIRNLCVGRKRRGAQFVHNGLGGLFGQHVAWPKINAITVLHVLRG